VIGVNLLPDNVRAARKRRRQMRGWLCVAVLAATLASAPLGWNVLRRARAASLERQLSPLHADVDRVRNRLKNLAGEQVKLSAEIDRADALRRKRRWADLLTALSAEMPRQIWLTKLESINSQPGGAAPAPPSSHGHAAPAAPAPGKSAAPGDKPAPTVRLPGPVGLRLTGYALDHEWLYAFIGALKRMNVFDSIELTQADKQDLGLGEAVSFVVVCTWTRAHE
jgi:Tfp pilus assembly protein PilN